MKTPQNPTRWFIDHVKGVVYRHIDATYGHELRGEKHTSDCWVDLGACGMEQYRQQRKAGETRIAQYEEEEQP